MTTAQLRVDREPQGTLSGILPGGLQITGVEHPQTQPRPLCTLKLHVRGRTCHWRNETDFCGLWTRPTRRTGGMSTCSSCWMAAERSKRKISAAVCVIRLANAAVTTTIRLHVSTAARDRATTIRRPTSKVRCAGNGLAPRYYSQCQSAATSKVVKRYCAPVSGAIIYLFFYYAKRQPHMQNIHRKTTNTNKKNISIYQVPCLLPFLRYDRAAPLRSK